MALAKKEHIQRRVPARRGAALRIEKKIERTRESAKKLEGLRETAFLLGSPKNAARLRSALAQAKAGKLVERELDE